MAGSFIQGGGPLSPAEPFVSVWILYKRRGLINGGICYCGIVHHMRDMLSKPGSFTNDELHCPRRDPTSYAGTVISGGTMHCLWLPTDSRLNPTRVSLNSLPSSPLKNRRPSKSKAGFTLVWSLGSPPKHDCFQTHARIFRELQFGSCTPLPQISPFQPKDAFTVI